jgi:periplasmic protein TonB
MGQADFEVSRRPLLLTAGLSLLVHGAALLCSAPWLSPAAGVTGPLGQLQVRLVSPSPAAERPGADSAAAVPETAPANPPPELTVKTSDARRPPPVRRAPVAKPAPRTVKKPQPIKPLESGRRPPPYPGAEPAATPPAPAGEQIALLQTRPRYDADYLDNPAPEYPSLARRMRLQGRVVLRVHVGQQGDALEVLVETSSGHTILDKAALTAVRQWRFVPARLGREPIEAWVLLPLSFRLAGR